MHATKQRTVPLWAVIAKRRTNKYGSIPDLPDDELADPEELERQVYCEEFGPVLQLPVRGERSEFRPVVDENGQIDWGAFGTVNFDRSAMVFDKQLYRAGRLRDELESVLIMLGIINRRVPRKARNQALRCLHRGWIQPEQIASDDLRALVQLRSRARRLQDQLARLNATSVTLNRSEIAWLLS